MPIIDTLENDTRPAGGPEAHGSPATPGSPDGHAGLAIAHETLAGISCPVARPAGGCAAPGVLVVLDGTRVLRRVQRLVAEGRLEAQLLPVMVGVDPDPANRGLAQYTPWPHPAYKPGAPDFGGCAEEFLDQAVLPVARAARELASEPGGASGLFGYSLAGLFCLHALMRTDAFDTYLLASPSTWYPGVVNRVARTPLAADARVVLAHGADEGRDHPEPIAGIRQDTDRLVAALSERLSRQPIVVTDEFDHHAGFACRLQALLARW